MEKIAKTADHSGLLFLSFELIFKKFDSFIKKWTYSIPGLHNIIMLSLLTLLAEEEGPAILLFYLT